MLQLGRLVQGILNLLEGPISLCRQRRSARRMFVSCFVAICLRERPRFYSEVIAKTGDTVDKRCAASHLLPFIV
jgi:hypothetical protein